MQIFAPEFSSLKPNGRSVLLDRSVLTVDPLRSFRPLSLSSPTPSVRPSRRRRSLPFRPPSVLSKESESAFGEWESPFSRVFSFCFRRSVGRRWTPDVCATATELRFAALSESGMSIFEFKVELNSFIYYYNDSLRIVVIL